MKYKRIEDVIVKKNINEWFEKILDNGRMIYYEEYPSIDVLHIRVVVVIEYQEEEETKKKKRLFS